MYSGPAPTSLHPFYAHPHRHSITSRAMSSSTPATGPNCRASACRTATKSSWSSSDTSHSSCADCPLYGHEETARLCALFASSPPPTIPSSLSPVQICSLFQCPDRPIANHLEVSKPTLAVFIAYAIHHTRLPPMVTFTALLLLHRLKDRFPAARGSCGYRLFLSAFIIAAKLCCEETYSTLSWCIVAQHKFQLDAVNQMEREMCFYLDYNLHVKEHEVAALEALIRATYSPFPVAVEVWGAADLKGKKNAISCLPLPTILATLQSSNIVLESAPRICECLFTDALSIHPVPTMGCTRDTVV